jgi:hypothetical protein
MQGRRENATFALSMRVVRTICIRRIGSSRSMSRVGSELHSFVGVLDFSPHNFGIQPTASGLG